MSEILHKKGDPSMQDEYMDLINYTFGFNGNSSDFYKLLPKLYKKEYDPCSSSYVTVEDGKLKAAVGAFDINLEVGGEKLLCRGIGNVAVHPFRRSKGYMKALMNAALDDMIKDGVDFSALGGRRQRYNYFSFERGGPSFGCSVNADNMRHCFGNDRKHRFTVRTVARRDDPAIAEIGKLYSALPAHATRDGSDYFDILSSWSAKVYAAYEGDRFVGYAVMRSDTVSEILVTDVGDLTDLVICLYDHVGKSSISITVPPFLPEYIDCLMSFCEGFTVGCNEMYSIFNYRLVCSAFMKISGDLPDGELVLEIEGKAKTERLLFAVKDGIPSVTDTDREPAMTLSHLEAERLLFSPVCVTRSKLPAFARVWFPLPLWLYSADMV